MLFKIQKSLGRVSAVFTDTIWKEGVCIDFQKYGSDDASIVIYQGGRLEDTIKLNGWSFPCVYNGMRRQQGRDIYGGKYYHVVTFEALDTRGSLQTIDKKKVYGDKEAIAVEYFYTMLHNLSYCKDVLQFTKLYEYLIDNEDIICLYEGVMKGTTMSIYRSDREKISGALYFIETFRNQLGDVEDTVYVSGLKQRMDYTYKAVLGIMSSPVYKQD